VKVKTQKKKLKNRIINKMKLSKTINQTLMILAQIKKKSKSKQFKKRLTKLI